MKIGILTLPFHVNYGGILQAYALQTVLERMGHEVDVIEIKKEKKHTIKSTIVECKNFIKRFIKKFILQKPVYLFLDRAKTKLIPVTHQYTNEFIRRYLHLRKYENACLINQNDYEAYVVGSDQVWRPKYSPNIYHAYLDFTEGWDVKRISYAASFGSDTWEYTDVDTEKCRKLVSHFDAVSVREDSGIGLCKKYLKVSSLQTLDPTLLLDRADYDYLISSYNTSPSDGNLFNYILDTDERTEEIIRQIAADKELKPFRKNVWEPYAKVESDAIVPIEQRIQPPVEQWLRSFRDSEFIVTDSFHACVFSIIFEKPFAVILNAQRGNGRISSLLRLLGEEHRLIGGIDDYRNNRKEILSSPNIVKLKAMREKSLNYLLK